MRVLMLGWEFPPFIAGGLGTACYGLTKALDRKGCEVIFVLPKAVDQSHSSHVRLLSPETATTKVITQTTTKVVQTQTPNPPPSPPKPNATETIIPDTEATQPAKPPHPPKTDDPEITRWWREFEHVTFRTIPSSLSSPYGEQAALTPEVVRQMVEEARKSGAPMPPEIAAVFKDEQLTATDLPAAKALAAAFGETIDESTVTTHTTEANNDHVEVGKDYGGDLISDVRRYAEMALRLSKNETFDVIHAHDWMTYAAGMAIARYSGKPLVVHVHSTEFDRSGENVNQFIYDIERRGMHSAMRIITVSYWTKNIILKRYGVDEDRVRVVWNGIDKELRKVKRPDIRSDDKIVLFLGRITMQKGPEYFIAAAKRVLEKINNVKFIVAGSGDMARRMIEMAASMGIGHKVLFTGFLRGDDVAKVFKMADCYVMPSVSEPFGISPLEALSHNVPVIISKQSGVSEVLTHALKIDFWDVDEMANKIVAVLKHPPLSQTMKHHGEFELRQLTWDGAAEKCIDIYQDAYDEVPSFTHEPEPVH